MPRERIAGIDAGRCIACFSVVLLHALPAGESARSFSVGLIDIATRFAVPFFFIASGFFLYKYISYPIDGATKAISRIIPVYVF